MIQNKLQVDNGDNSYSNRVPVWFDTECLLENDVSNDSKYKIRYCMIVNQFVDNCRVST